LFGRGADEQQQQQQQQQLLVDYFGPNQPQKVARHVFVGHPHTNTQFDILSKLDTSTDAPYNNICLRKKPASS
jgi:hypothetical protein